MVKAARQAATIILFIISLYLAYTFPRQASYPCSPSVALVLTVQHMGYAYTATASRPDSSAASLYISKKTGDWLLISHDFDMHSCITDQGNGWDWALGITPL